MLAVCLWGEVCEWVRTGEVVCWVLRFDVSCFMVFSVLYEAFGEEPGVGVFWAGFLGYVGRILFVFSGFVVRVRGVGGFRFGWSFVGSVEGVVFVVFSAGGFVISGCVFGWVGYEVCFLVLVRCFEVGFYPFTVCFARFFVRGPFWVAFMFLKVLCGDGGSW